MREFHHGCIVSVYDKNGNFEMRARIAGRHKVVGGSYMYDVEPLAEYSLKLRECGIPEARIRKHYIPPHLVENNKHINDLVGCA